MDDEEDSYRCPGEGVVMPAVHGEPEVPIFLGGRTWVVCAECAEKFDSVLWRFPS